MSELAAWRTWLVKRRWYERNRRLSRRWRINRHVARAGAYIRYPVDGEVLFSQSPAHAGIHPQ